MNFKPPLNRNFVTLNGNNVYLSRMLTFSIIVPSFNQERFIGETLESLAQIKKKATERAVQLQIILVDNCSAEATQAVIKEYNHIIDKLIVEKDKGQYDAINKGLEHVNGEYWTWLNTDDLIDEEGFWALASKLKEDPAIDYIYGDNEYINEHSAFIKNAGSDEINLEKLVNKDASITQPGSFFKTEFTQKIGKLAAYQFAFDYEYILRCLKHGARVHHLRFNVAKFRYYTTSKSGSKDYRFLTEQLQINRLYGGRFFSKLSFMLRLRIMKRKILN